MKILKSRIEHVEIAAPPPELAESLALPALALKYSVEVRNRAALPIAFLGVRFDMLTSHGKPAVFMHYGDMLRCPELADFLPGVERLICIEQIVTVAVRRGLAFESLPARAQALANLENVNRMLSVVASVDCVAFTDGRFVGPDTGGAFERLSKEVLAEKGRAKQADPSRPPRLPVWVANR